MSEQINASNRTVTKNAFFMTIRMIIVTIVGIYTSRIVLSTLGVSDFGVFSVAGSLIAIISFLNSSMATASNRFLCIEMGRGNAERLSKTFSAALMIHILIALIVLTLAETLGLWFLNTKLSIPADRMYAANWVYQCSIISTCIGITQAPYSAVILAHEKMGIYAYFEIINVVLKLLILYLLVILPGDKLVDYAILLLCVSIINIVINRVYCISKFKESVFKWKYEKEFFMPLLKYSTTDLYGNVCLITFEQSRPILLNLFFGVIYNAAGALALTVHYVVSSLSTNILIAFKPHIIKLYAQNKIQEMEESMNAAIRFGSLFFALVCIPLILETSTVIQIWLGEIPPHLVTFLRVLLPATFITIVSGISCVAIHATGNIKRLSILTGSLYLCIPFIVYLVFKSGFPAWSMYAIYGCMLVIITGVDLLIMKSNIREIKVLSLIKNSFITYIVILISAIPTLLLLHNLPTGFLRLFYVTITFALTLFLFSWFFLLDSIKREKIVIRIKSKLRYKR